MYLATIYATIFRKTTCPVSEKINCRVHAEIRIRGRDTNGIKKKKCVLLIDGASDWLQIWTAESSLNIKGNKAIKQKFVFLCFRMMFYECGRGSISLQSPATYQVETDRCKRSFESVIPDC